MKNQRLLERKQELKKLAKDGREYRRRNGCGWTPYSDKARFKHIAYCIARGRKYLEIERKTREDNFICEYKWEIINKDIAELQEGSNEDVYISA